MNLKDRIVFITGASAGIGRACAESFAAAGAHLILTARRRDRLEEAAFSLASQYGVPVHSVELDVRDPEAIASAVSGLPDSLGEIDILVNNAGKAKGRDSVHEASQTHLDEMIDTNIRGVVDVTRAVLPGMVERGRGHIIMIGSSAARWIYPGGAVYCATKAAVYALSEGLKMDLHGTGIRVSTVDPGLVETEFSLVRFDGDAAPAEAVYTGMTPLTAVDVAEAVMFCASRPPHVNISQILMLPTDQSSTSMVYRRS